MRVGREASLFVLSWVLAVANADGQDVPSPSGPEAQSTSVVGPPRHAPESPEAAFRRLVDAKDDWREEADAARALGSLGSKALRLVIREAESHPEARARRACFKLLYTDFADEPRARDAISGIGLASSDGRIRYEAAYHLGELRVYDSHHRLRKFMEDLPKDELVLRVTCAKSLAELGEGDVIRVLYEGATDDAYMPRHMGNAGLKELTGKNLDDFEDYNSGEGAFVSGGIEAQFAFDAVRVAERKAKRFAAAASYFRWLKDERPDLYKHLTSSF